ncbi:diphthine synthase [Candidatus Woesearchaeota archaeon]|nr:diphthine synthase [Candidatus Woesearchaeota archaeon]
MTLYMIGIGLSDEKDISVKGLEAVKKCERIFLESYTSVLSVPVSKLEKFYNKKIIPADRDMVEKNSDKILSKKDTAFLIIGDVFSATTHVDLMQRAKEKGIEVKIIHGASVVSAIGVTGLEVYKFGKITSIPFENKNVKTPVEVLKENQKAGLHTLFLLDLRPNEDKFLTIADAADYLIKNGVKENTFAVGCARVGSEKQVIKYRRLIDLKKENFGKPPYCLIIPGKLHFIEEEMLNQS